MHRTITETDNGMTFFLQNSHPQPREIPLPRSST